MARGATATVEEPEQGEMFPDLDPKKPADAALIKKAKAWIKIVDDRKEYLDDAKKREDEAHEEMVAAAHTCNLAKFSVAGREVVIETKEKAKVKTAKVDDENSDE